MPTPPAPSSPVWISDAEFARRLIRRAVTTERVEQALAGLTANALPFNAISAGLGGLARVTVTGTLRAPRVRQHVDDPDTFAVTVPATLDLVVRLGSESHIGADVEIDLALTPRPAEPLLLVIDIAPITEDDVRVSIRGGGLGASIAALLGPVADEIGRQMLTALTTLLDTSKVRAGRTIDVAARIDGRPDDPPPDPWVWLDDETFGQRFLRAAVTEQRLTDGFAQVAGTPLSIGPITAGPRDMATIRADGTVGAPRVTARDGGPVGFDATVPLDLDLVVAVGRENKYHCAITVGLNPIVRPADPLQLVLDIAPVTPADVGVDVDAKGHLASLLGRVGHIEDQLRSQVVSNVNSRLADTAGRTFDIGARIDGA